MTPTADRRPSALARAVVATSIATTLAGGAALLGCRGSASKPVAEIRYEALGPKADLPEYLNGTVFEAADLYGTDNQRISGYGVVVNLENTGRDDGISTPIRDFVLSNSFRRGVGSEFTDGTLGQLSGRQLMADPRTAVVRVDGIVPPGARAGQRIDVRVSAIDTNTTTSLARGELWQTELHAGQVTPQNPGERVNKVGQARGRLVVNPVYALQDPTQVKDDGSARESLRSAYIPAGAIFEGDRTFALRLRNPSYRTSRAIEKRINLHFGLPVASAQDEGSVRLAMPPQFEPDEWPRFVGVAMGLYFYSVNKGYAVEQAQTLAAVAQNPATDPAKLELISYAWEGLGMVGAPTILPLFSHPNPAVAFWSARAAAFAGEPAAVAALGQQAATPQNPYAPRAVETLGRLPGTPERARTVRALLNVDDSAVRIAAYQALLRIEERLEGKSITTVSIGRRDAKQFYLDLVPSTGRTLVFATRRGTPRIAVIGPRPVLKTPLLATAFKDRLSINADDDDRPATVFYRPHNDRRAQATIRPDLTDLIACLGGDAAPGVVPIDLGYGDVLAVLKQLTESGDVLAGGRPVPLILDDPAADFVEDAPIIPGLEDLTAQNPPPPAGGRQPGVSGGTAAGVSASPAVR